MKKILKLQTGIVLLIAILLAAACGNSKMKDVSAEKTNDPPKEVITQAEVKPDSTRVFIYLKEKEINGIMHLEMSDSRKPECPVIDNLETVVFPGDTVIFDKAQHSKVKEVLSVSLVEHSFITFAENFRENEGLYVLIIDTCAPLDTTLKYDIKFAINKDSIYTIDPYLRLPKQTLGK